MDEKVKTKAITLRPSEVAILHQIGKDYGLASFSAAVRFVLADWMKMKRADYGDGRNSKEKTT